MIRLRHPDRGKCVRWASHVCDAAFSVALTLEVLVALFVVYLFVTFSCTPQREVVFDRPHTIHDETGAEPRGEGELRTYMDEVRPACVPIEGSVNEPCTRRLPWSIDSYPKASVSFSDDFIKSFPINVEEEMRRSWNLEGLKTPQVIMRGTVLPGSARCVADGAVLVPRKYHYKASHESPLEVCYIDIAVNEYIVGGGPSRVTVVAGWNTRVYTGGQNYGTPDYYDLLAEPIRESMEGIEFIFDLVRPWNSAHADWGFYNLWDVQRKPNGELVGVSRWLGLVGTYDTLDQFEHPLAELQETMKTVHAKISTEMGGRISDEPGSPMLVADASRESLLAQLRELGAYDVPGITPMPAPPAPDLR